MRVCVYCASSADIADAHVAMAQHTGTWIGEHGHTLVWGGCNLGLMQAVGAATQAAGGRVIAVVPGFLNARDLAFATADEIVITETLAERKRYMRENADVFVALSGGIGTWDEVLEVLALKKLARTDAPIVLANVNGYFDPLLSMIERSVEERFNPRGLSDLFEIVRDPQTMSDALDAATRSRTPETSFRPAPGGDRLQ